MMLLLSNIKDWTVFAQPLFFYQNTFFKTSASVVTPTTWIPDGVVIPVREFLGT